MTFQTFIANSRITLTADRTDENPNMPDSHDMDHWKCVLKRPGHRMTVYFSKGYGHNGAPPAIDEVLDCLASDSAGSDEMFESWCNNLGYDSDSRTAERIFNTCRRQAVRLKAFLGDDAFQTLLYDLDR